MLAGFLVTALLLAFASAGSAAILGFSVFGVILFYMVGGVSGLLLGVVLASRDTSGAAKTSGLGAAGVRTGGTVSP